MVYVLDYNGKPLMPTKRHGKVRRILRDKKAKVVKRMPFTIKLLYKTTSHTQDLTLGIDTGSRTIGCAVANKKGEILYASEVVIRSDIKRKMDRRRVYRRSRRSRKTRYRKPRFLNRKNSISKNRFNATMTSKIHRHIAEIESIKKILPITRLVIETGHFDPHLIKNPTLHNQNVAKWGYQKGLLYGYTNLRHYILFRDHYTCQCCKSQKGTLEVHHIVPRNNGGGNQPENLITLCHDCHKAVHNDGLVLKIKGKGKSQLNHATQMNSIRMQLLKIYPEAIETFGYVTKANRQELHLHKEHYIDACVIASAGHAVDLKNTLVFLKRCVPKGDYQQTKGKRSEKKIPTGKIHGFRKFDKVSYFGKEYFIKGRRAAGTCILMDINKNTVSFDYLPRGFKTPKLLNCKRKEARTGVLCEAILPSL